MNYLRVYYSNYRGLELAIMCRFMIYDGVIWAPAYNDN